MKAILIHISFVLTETFSGLLCFDKDEIKDNFKNEKT